MTKKTDFTRDTEPFRRELLAHCYRMLGSIDDAQDLLQEALLRAWRSYSSFEGRSSLRTWLYRIATNVCLTALETKQRRRPSDGIFRGSDTAWLQPVPDALIAPLSDDPQERAAFRDSVRLALIAALQVLPSRQRAVLLLTDVLDWPAADVAEALGSTAAAVKSSLQRARARLQEVAPTAESVSESTEPESHRLLLAYISAFERADPRALESVLRHDLLLELPPSAGWFTGQDAIKNASGALGFPGEWRMLPTAANGQPAAGVYRRDTNGAHRAFGVVVLTVTPGGISRITVFTDPDLFDAFSLPSSPP